MLSEYNDLKNSRNLIKSIDIESDQHNYLEIERLYEEGFRDYKNSKISKISKLSKLLERELVTSEPIRNYFTDTSCQDFRSNEL